MTNPVARPPLDISLVLDRSGSMGGQKVALAREAAKGAVRLLRETDRCALVAYDDQIDVAAPIGAVDAAQRDRIGRALDAIDARGSTDLFGGWMQGAEQIGEGVADRLRRVILLTDGLANVGVVDHDEIVGHVRELNIRGVGTSTFGVGRDFDEDLVSSIAEAGGGHFYFIENPRQIPDFLASELGELLTVVALGVRVRVNVNGGASIFNINDLPIAEGGWMLGDLAEMSEIDLLFTLDLPADSHENIELEVTVEWTDGATHERRSADQSLRLIPGTAEAAEAAPVDTDTIRQAVKTYGAKTRNEALKHNRAHRYDAARSLLAHDLNELEALVAKAPDAKEDLQELRLSMRGLADEMDPMERKRQHMASYSARHSRTQK
jgi:Ca-activated chloride channel family protein